MLLSLVLTNPLILVLTNPLSLVLTNPLVLTHTPWYYPLWRNRRMKLMLVIHW